MKYLLLLIFVFSFLLYSCHSNKISAGQRDTKNWVMLFNGKDLDHWVPKIAGYKLGENFGNTFRVADGMLSTRYNEYDSFNKRFGALYYDKKFTNYRLRVEYRFVGNTAPGGPPWGFRDGGIQYHCQPPATLGFDQPFPVCLEYNLLGSNGKDERPTGEICASGIYVQINGKRNTSYCTPPLVKRSFSGDQWVTAEIDVRDGTITHFVNGEQIIQFKNPMYDSANTIVKKFITNGDETVRDGYISIKSNSHPMDFKRIEIMEY